MRHVWIIVSFLVLGMGIGRLSHTPTLKVCGQLDEAIHGALDARGVKVHYSDNLTTVDLSQPDEVVAALSRALHNTQTEQDIVRHNIANYQTTRTANGEPYRRQFARYSSDGDLHLEFDESDFRYVYDPAHPDAHRDGCKAGYIAYPNVNLEQESTRLRYLESRESFLRQSLLQVDPNLIIPEIRMCRYPKATEQSKKVAFVGLMSETELGFKE